MEVGGSDPVLADWVIVDCLARLPHQLDVIPAKAGTHPEMLRLVSHNRTTSGWAPACAGVTPWVREHR